MLTEQNVTQIEKTRSEIIKAKDLGVSYISGYRADDYKSHIFNLLMRKGKTRQNVTWPFKNLNLTGYQGEILGIIGSNGSGKTTLCKVISGILAPDEGTMEVDGKVSALFSLGLGFNKELTGRENVYLNGMMLGINRIDIRGFIDEIQEFSGLGSFMDEPIKRYSSGMKARLGFSIAAFLEPEVLVLDEALNTGDLEFGNRAAEKMRELVQKAKMVVLVTHSIQYAKANCDRIIWLDQGKIRADGDPNEVAELYQASMPPAKKRRKRTLELAKTNLNLGDNIVVEAENLGVTYKMRDRKFQALQNINFQIREGEVVGIIGHNGAGKSTLCKVLTQILSPDEGNLTVNGQTTALLGFGGGFNSQLSGRDNIYVNGMLLGIPKRRIQRSYPDIVEFSELGKAINKPVKQYSSGMRSRLGFSTAAALQPDIFIIDEALSAGDMAFQQKASERIQEMIEQAKAVIIVTHSMAFVEKVCTRVLWVSKGKLRFDGEASEGVRQYRQDVKEQRANKKKTLRV